jgi:hypothetical protein
LPVLRYSCPEPFSDQAEQPLVGNTMPQEFQQPFV